MNSHNVTLTKCLIMCGDNFNGFQMYLKIEYHLDILCKYFAIPKMHTPNSAFNCNRDYSLKYFCLLSLRATCVYFNAQHFMAKKHENECAPNSICTTLYSPMQSKLCVT